MKCSTICGYDAPVAPRRPTTPSPLTYQLAQLAYALHAALERHLHDTLEELELTLTLADALWQLDPALGPLSRRELAERLRCDPSNVTFLVDRLERRRLVSRAPAEGDRRIKALTLTPTGIRARHRLIAAIAESRMFSQMTSAQKRQLADLLGRCVSSGIPLARAPSSQSPLGDQQGHPRN
jgi:MarR family transcriptional regulator, organic hydroperoxide resistance regulator